MQAALIVFALPVMTSLAVKVHTSYLLKEQRKKEVLAVYEQDDAKRQTQPTSKNALPQIRARL